MDFVKRIIDEWDPIDLLSHAPDDEYVDLAEGIFNVFVESFGKDTFNKSKEECEHIAQILLSLKC